MKKLLLLSLLGLAAFGADARIASDGGFSPEKGLDVNASFAAQREAILAALGNGKTYAEITPENRRRVTASLDRIAALLGDRQQVSELPERTRLEVFNEQELVNTLLAGAREDSRLVCTREKRVGSHRATTQCMTVAERRRAREESQDELRDMQRSPIMSR
ncbi:MAG TPA: hypothetical protein VFF91_07275 [Pseudoxanthomonas sp.]|nr:hypothetical protein [Pseudoxanthomonas sp.]